jgi:hypothetical protein
MFEDMSAAPGAAFSCELSVYFHSGPVVACKLCDARRPSLGPGVHSSSRIKACNCNLISVEELINDKAYALVFGL